MAVTKTDSKNLSRQAILFAILALGSIRHPHDLVCVGFVYATWVEMMK
ncbi:hypothetical protein W909_16785 [Dickeya zeae EC1]|nr:hypothetical protein W909_16785 [Dickeya zeae EC1]